MLKNFKLHTKLGVGFGLLTLIALIIGVVALYNNRVLAGNIYEIGGVRMPSLYGLQLINEAQTAIESREFALLYRQSTPEQVKEGFARTEQALTRVKKGWDI